MRTGNPVLLFSSALATVILIALGTWQIQRLQWKNDLIEKIQHAQTSNPVTLTDIEAGIEHGFDVDWLKTRANGHFRHDLERHVYQLRNGKIGWRIITPFIVPGRFAVLVDRGFVPDDRKNPATRPDSQTVSATAGASVAITGFVRLDAELAGPFTPANQPEANRWYSIDLIAMADTMPDDLGFVEPDQYAALLPVLIQLAPQGRSQTGTLPIVDPVKVDLPNSHLQYAVIWYSLAVVLIVMSFLFYRSRKAQQCEATNE